MSEKPIAENVKAAQELIKWYYGNIDSRKVTWSVAENFRYLKGFEHGREQILGAGKLLQFKVKAYNFVKEGGKYIGRIILPLALCRLITRTVVGYWPEKVTTSIPLSPRSRMSIYNYLLWF